VILSETRKEVTAVTKKELKLLGMALKALLDADMIEAVKKIVTEMAEAKDEEEEKD